MTKNQNDLYDKLLYASSKIHEKILKNSGDYIVVSPEVANKINENLKRIEQLNDRKNKLKKLNNLN